MTKFLIVLFLALIAVTVSTPVNSPTGKTCDVGHKILQDGEVGAAPLGECQDVQCKNGDVVPLIGCPLIKLDDGCPLNEAKEDLTKLYPECCPSPHC